MDSSEQGQARLGGGVGRPPALFRRLYEDEDYSISQLSTLFDCSPTAILDDLCDLDLLDEDAVFSDRLPRYRTADKYEVWEHGRHRVRVHRLLMVAERGFEAVANARDIHHESFPWDNRPHALVLCETREDHMGHHNDRLDGDHEDQQQLSQFVSSQVESESSEGAEELERDDDPDVGMEPQRTLDEFVRV